MPFEKALSALLIGAAILFIFWLDRSTGDAPVQHLYYLPIMFTAIRFGMAAGVGTSLSAIALYHLAANRMSLVRYQEADILKMALFIGIGLVTAKLSADAKRLRKLASTDDLTGLHNLRSFEAEMLRMAERMRHMRQPMSLLVLDVDRLKQLNDQYGHFAGAEAVRLIGQILAGTLPQESVACRYGGDEFVIALPQFTSAEAEREAERIRDAIAQTAPVLLDREWPCSTLSVSIGVACLVPSAIVNSRPDGLSTEQQTRELFDAADQALYLAKAAGRNCVRTSVEARPMR